MMLDRKELDSEAETNNTEGLSENELQQKSVEVNELSTS